MTYIRDHHHFLGHNVVQDEGEGHLIVIIQQGVDGFLQPHQPVLLLRTCTHARTHTTTVLIVEKRGSKIGNNIKH